ncbi:GNAT family N-acetyltransferase [Allorhizocola rhizosphaerae]|uniref:GNAT family N-acetyltransferase n=1 Tax=Allorhizocola rhizosphaerae TaxID=1872709 RepID=UPI000E3EC005|nr:GNAT family N-acetyltransferase [Allorhizocola rhizosphaerae]
MGIDVRDAPELERFEARDDDGQPAGFVTYQVTGSVIVYTHTEVKQAFQGQGVGSALARAVMEDAKARGRTVVPMCPYLVKWLDKHPEYEPIIARTTKRVK